MNIFEMAGNSNIISGVEFIQRKTRTSLPEIPSPIHKTEKTNVRIKELNAKQIENKEMFKFCSEKDYQARIAQLEKSLKYLQAQQKDMLGKLHKELENLQEKNKDLNFILMISGHSLEKNNERKIIFLKNQIFELQNQLNESQKKYWQSLDFISELRMQFEAKSKEKGSVETKIWENEPKFMKDEYFTPFHSYAQAVTKPESPTMQIQGSSVYKKGLDLPPIETVYKTPKKILSKQCNCNNVEYLPKIISNCSAKERKSCSLKSLHIQYDGKIKNKK